VHPLTALSEYRLAHHRIRRDARRSCVRTFPNLQSLAVITTLASGLLFPGYRKKTLWRVAMAQVIEFYTPARFHKPVKWVPPAKRGKVLDFPAAIQKSA
jgi:low temperature requirement protein LtrA